MKGHRCGVMVVTGEQCEHRTDIGAREDWATGRLATLNLQEVVLEKARKLKVEGAGGVGLKVVEGGREALK